MPLQWRNQFWESLEEGVGKRCSECEFLLCSVCLFLLFVCEPVTDKTSSDVSQFLLGLVCLFLLFLLSKRVETFGSFCLVQFASFFLFVCETVKVCIRPVKPHWFTGRKTSGLFTLYNSFSF